jgi:CHAD domain-containing protein
MPFRAVLLNDPRQAVRQGDELVAQVMKSLAETFSSERAKLEGHVDQTDKASTEDLRVALRRYRSFFERLLSL